MSRTLLRILAVLVFAGVALTVHADTFNIGGLNLAVAESRESQQQVAVLRPTESAPESATLLVFGAGLGLTAWRVRRNGVKP
jgi:hypothetical protein